MMWTAIVWDFDGEPTATGESPREAFDAVLAAARPGPGGGDGGPGDGHPRIELVPRADGDYDIACGAFLIGRVGRTPGGPAHGRPAP